jgi:hypothetical protein
MSNALASQEAVRALSFIHNLGGIRRPERRMSYPMTDAEKVGWKATEYALKRLKRVYPQEENL